MIVGHDIDITYLPSRTKGAQDINWTACPSLSLALSE
jgi:hypothetical protein